MTGPAAVALAARLRARGPDIGPPAHAGGLGYRGLIVRAGGEVWRVGDGRIERDGRWQRDGGIEGALLATLPAELRERYAAALPKLS